jgi:hypothetical protein
MGYGEGGELNVSSLTYEPKEFDTSAEFGVLNSCYLISSRINVVIQGKTYENYSQKIYITSNKQKKSHFLKISNTLI